MRRPLEISQLPASGCLLACLSHCQPSLPASNPGPGHPGLTDRGRRQTPEGSVSREVHVKSHRSRQPIVIRTEGAFLGRVQQHQKKSFKRTQPQRQRVTVGFGGVPATLVPVRCRYLGAHQESTKHNKASITRRVLVECTIADSQLSSPTRTPRASGCVAHQHPGILGFFGSF